MRRASAGAALGRARRKARRICRSKGRVVTTRAIAIVFAYHNVGVRCLEVLLAHGVDIPLILTHRDNPAENIWFESVGELAAKHNIRAITPDDPNAPDIVARIRALAPDFLFSFYYRNMLKPELLVIPKRGALNMHGSLLPKYRGRVPINWAVLNGETETGATLHYMVDKPDAGDIVGQQKVAILPDDAAFDVFGKVTAAAATVLDRSLPGLVAGTNPRIPQDLTQGSYFGGRKPEDGRIDWRWPAARVHNLVRAVAPPYPGAFATIEGRELRVLRTRLAPPAGPATAPALYTEAGRCYARCGDGARLEILAMELDGAPLAASAFEQRFNKKIVLLENT
jgi:methionyl-tRNA formyltransferase